jgi:hypothetical protein
VATALSSVAAIVAGRPIGRVALWGYAASAIYTAAASNAVYAGMRSLDVLWTALAAAPIGAFVIWYGSRRLHASITQRLWPSILADHASAADEFEAAIRDMPIAVWTSRPSPEAWSPAEITEHLSRTYSQYAGESRGKNSLRKRLGIIGRVIANVVFKPRLLAGAPFPKAKAPRVLRPSGGPPTPADGVALFRATGEACLRDLDVLVRHRPYARLVHPYFGALPLHEAVRFASHHIRHHRRQLPATILSSEPRNDVTS